MSTARQAILLMNLGSPDSTAVKDVRRYLRQFLMDERVIDMPLWSRTLLVKGIIVPLRAPKSAKAYASIWTKEGSPLIVLTKQLKEALGQLTDNPIEICMRYGNPSPKYALDQLQQKHPQLEEVILVPLYPHYAWSSYETAALYAIEAFQKGNYGFNMKVVPPFYNNDRYITALANSLKPYLKDGFDLLDFSYHGIPERHITKRHSAGAHQLQSPESCCTDASLQRYCYRHQVIETTKLVAAKLGLPKEKYIVSFQSRLGRDPWLQPYTAKSLEEWPKQGYKKIVVACPAFVSDCLETIEEMGEEGKEIFLHAGGESFTLVPCLNTFPEWVSTLHELLDTAVPCEEEGLLERR